MAIVKNSFRVSKMEGDLSCSEEDEELGSASSAGVSDASDEDSGMGSDEYDLSELGEAGTELCQVGNQSCSIPLELYDLPGLAEILSIETWNQCLSEEERFALSAYLPDMDQETFALTLSELFSGVNLHFGSPLAELFGKLKGGLCEPRVVLYRRGENSFLRRKHYHMLRRYHNNMVGRLLKIRDAWQYWDGYPIEERLRILDIMKSNGRLGPGGGDAAVSDTESERQDLGKKIGNKRMKVSKSSYDLVGLKPGKYAKEGRKGLLKVAAPKAPAKKGYIGAEVQYQLPQEKLLGVHQQELVAGYAVEDVPKREHVTLEEEDGYDSEEQEHIYGSQGDWGATEKKGLLMSGKNHQSVKRYDSHSPVQFRDLDPEGYNGSVQYFDNRDADQKVTIASYGRYSHDTKKQTKYSDKDWSYPTKGQGMKGVQVDWSDASQPFGRRKMHGDALAMDHQGDFSEWNTGGKKLKAGAQVRFAKSKAGTDSKVLHYNTYPAETNGPYFLSDLREKSGEKFGNKYSQNGLMDVDYSSHVQCEETESDSSGESEEDVDANPRVMTMGYPVAKPVYDQRKANKLGNKDKKLSHFVDGGGSTYPPDVELQHSAKVKLKGKTDANLQKKVHPYQKEVLASVPKAHHAEKKRKGMFDSDYALLQSNNMHNYGNVMVDEPNEYFDGNEKTLVGNSVANVSGNRKQVTNNRTPDDEHHGRMNMPLLGCNTVTKKQKGKLDGLFRAKTDDGVYLQTSSKKLIDDPNKMKKGKKNADAGTGPLTHGNPEITMPEKETADVEPEIKMPKKPFTPITPTVHTGFSFSIVHLLSAVRKALVTPVDDTTGVSNHIGKDGGRPKMNMEEQNLFVHSANSKLPSPFDETDLITSEPAGQKNLPSLTVQEIVTQVKSNPLDPCILETQEPLHDLVRGVLKIFSSKTAPLGAKGWKALVSYEKSNKSWSWNGPVSSSPLDSETVEEETSSEAWGIPHKMLVKLVDAFANWLKSGQETLQQIGSLPPPPCMPPCLEEKERFKDLRAQKSSNTISKSSDEVRTYFRRQEFLRYAVPDRAFSYTAADGKKSIVAPLRRGGGKPTSKARDHFLLKPDRPPHVTILCLVRDAAARLPGSIGTRADVCTLIRDSQYIVEDVSDQQVNQIVSGALDRLHYERDPCVQFDPDRKLWVYLHRDREEEDFEDDGTSSTKKWKRQRKDPTEQSDMGAANELSYDAGGNAAVGGSCVGYGFNADLNIDSSSFQAEENPELVYNDLRPSDNFQHLPGLMSGTGNKMQCQENSTSEDFL